MPHITGEEYEYVDSAEALSSMTELARAADEIAVDTEADSLHNYEGKTCLMQFTFGQYNFIIDTLASLDLTEFFSVIESKNLILHGSDYDLRMLFITFGFRPKGKVFDTLLAAQLLGHEKLGLAALAERYCSVIMCKAGQKTDWSQRPLTEDQLRYACDDTRYLMTIAHALKSELEACGRLAWQTEACERVVRSTGLIKEEDKENKWRIKGSSKLDRLHLAYLKALWHWRENEARKADRPPFKIMNNEPLVSLVVHISSSKDTIEFPHYIKGERLAALKESIENVKRMGEHDYPPKKEKKPFKEFFSLRNNDRIDVVRDACKTLAEKLKISPSLIASRAMIEKIVANDAKTHKDLMAIDGMMSWQAVLLVEALAEKIR
jgi:ribonuclease D